MFPLLPHQVVTQNGSVLQKGRLGIDRDTITYSRLHKHLTNIFRLGDRNFKLTYETQNLGQPETKVISDDWELEVALQQPKLCLTAEIEVETLTKADKSWDILAIDDNMADETKHTSAANKVSSLFDKLVNKVEGLVFPNKDEEKDGPIPSTKPPMTLKEFQNYLDCEGRMTNYQAFRENVYLGGISHSLRKIAWRHLLCVFPEGTHFRLYSVII
ncbi:TBC1D25 [Bugula neritina]|uniref:TBC1D25 n=1 Tax=Bugula neritina TaxID=10212 RepID=A0A7J7JUE5_BUGNE|nr:TBC1D25 [Bugula neritina]